MSDVFFNPDGSVHREASKPWLERAIQSAHERELRALVVNANGIHFSYDQRHDVSDAIAAFREGIIAPGATIAMHGADGRGAAQFTVEQLRAAGAAILAAYADARARRAQKLQALDAVLLTGTDAEIIHFNTEEL